MQGLVGRLQRVRSLCRLQRPAPGTQVGDRHVATRIDQAFGKSPHRTVQRETARRHGKTADPARLDGQKRRNGDDRSTQGQEQCPGPCTAGPCIGNEEVRDESSPPRSGEFQSDLCLASEHEARRAEVLGARVVRMRFGVVLGRSGGAYPLLALIGLGAVLGSGLQPAPWIHLDDAVGLIRFAMAYEGVEGPINARRARRAASSAIRRGYGCIIRSQDMDARARSTHACTGRRDVDAVAGWPERSAPGSA